LGEGVTIIDLDEKCVFANPAAEILFGVEYKELVGYKFKRFSLQKKIFKKSKKKLKIENKGSLQLTNLK